MNLVNLYLFASISVAFAVLPTTIDPRFTSITKMEIQIKVELKRFGIPTPLNTYESEIFDIIPEFIATVDTTRLLIKKEYISDVIEDFRTKIQADKQAAYEKEHENNHFLDFRRYFDIRFSVLVNKTGEITFQEMDFRSSICYYYFKLQGGKTLADKQTLNCYTDDGTSATGLKNVTKGGEAQIQVPVDPKLYTKITANDDDMNVIDATFQLTGPYYGVDVLLVA